MITIGRHVVGLNRVVREIEQSRCRATVAEEPAAGKYLDAARLLGDETVARAIEANVGGL